MIPIFSARAMSGIGEAPNTTGTTILPSIAPAALLLCLALSACNLDTPQVSAGHVSVLEPGRAVRARELSPPQVGALNAWLHAHRSGWVPSLFTPTAGVLVSLEAVGGSQWGIYIQGTTVVVAGGDVRLTQTFAAPSVEALLAALGVAKGSDQGGRNVLTRLDAGMSS